MQYAQYERIETLAGGVNCTPRQFIKAAHTKLTEKGRSREMRTQRHAWLREGLSYNQSAKNLLKHYTL